jgi:hypothetical protein
MNRHRYGAPKGLPLPEREIVHWAKNWASGPWWEQKRAARIVDGELILCMTHTLEGRRHKVRDAFNKNNHRLCHHTSTHPADVSVLPWRNRLLDVPELADVDLVKTYEACTSSCRVCLMDYTVTIARAHAHEVVTLSAAAQGVRNPFMGFCCWRCVFIR